MPTVPATHEALADHGIGFLSTIGSDGLPQVTALGFARDGDVFRMSFTDARQKFRNVSREPGCTLFAVDLTNPGRTIEIRGRGELVADPDFHWARFVAAKNGSSEADVRSRTVPGELRYCLVLHPSRINAWGS